MKQSVNEDKLLKTLYDEIIIPMELAECHYKSAIAKRNRWIIDRCSHLICFIQRDFGGAYTTYQYAKKKGLTIKNVANENVANRTNENVANRNEGKQNEDSEKVSPESS